MKKGKRKVRISQCMIVKNEERNIERALSWGREIMWEQIVVDTGSTDRTVELAEKMGAKVVHFPWINDFAAAKNFAIEQAKGDWIAFLDADEYLSPEGARDIEDLLDRLLDSDFDGVSASCLNLDANGKVFAGGTLLRFFRNIPDIRYRRRIHEQLFCPSGRELHIGDVSQELSIYHTGYQGEGYKEKTKCKRNYQLILEELKEHPDNTEMMGYLGDEYMADGNREEAEVWYRKAFSLMPDGELYDDDQRSAITLTKLLIILAEKPGSIWNRDIEPVYQKAVRIMPQESDFDYMAGQYFAAVGRADKAVWHLEEAIRKLDTYGCRNKALHLKVDMLRVYDLLARCCYEADEPQKCVTYAVNYLKCDKYGMAPLSRLLKVLLQSDRRFGGQDNLVELQAVLEFLAKLYDFSVLKDRLFVIKAAEKSGCQNFAHYTAGCFFSEEERKTLGL